MALPIERMAAVLGLLCLAMASFAGPIDVLNACADQKTHVTGLTDLEKQCPLLSEALDALGFAPLLTPDVRAKLNDRSLADFVALASRYEGPRPSAGPRVSSLPAIVSAVNGQQPAVAKTWFDRAKAWVKQWLAQHHIGAADWLNRWWDRLLQSNGFLTTVGYLAMTLVVLAAAAVIFNELKALGLLRRKKAAHATSRATQPELLQAAALMPQSDAQGVGELFNRIVRYLVQSGRLSRAQGLTHRELLAHSTLDTQAQRAAFAQLAGSAEVLLYGPPEAARRDFSPVVAQAHTLLNQLSSESVSA
jgi:hypothetical protein